MKVTVNKQKEQTWPQLMCGIDSGVIVLMISIGTGTVIHVPTDSNADFKVGWTSCCWVQSQFVPFNGTVTLSND